MILLFPVLLNILLVLCHDQYLIQDSFIKKSDFEKTDIAILLRFYEFFDPATYQSAEGIDKPTVIEDLSDGRFPGKPGGDSPLAFPVK